MSVKKSGNMSVKKSGNKSGKHEASNTNWQCFLYLLPPNQNGQHGQNWCCVPLA